MNKHLELFNLTKNFSSKDLNDKYYSILDEVSSSNLSSPLKLLLLTTIDEQYKILQKYKTNKNDESRNKVNELNIKPNKCNNCSNCNSAIINQDNNLLVKTDNKSLVRNGTDNKSLVRDIYDSVLNDNNYDNIGNSVDGFTNMNNYMMRSLVSTSRLNENGEVITTEVMNEDINGKKKQSKKTYKTKLSNNDSINRIKKNPGKKVYFIDL